jgi:hypothetical protein
MPKTAIAPDDPSLTPRRLPRFPADLTTILILRLLRRRTRPLNVCFWPLASFRCAAKFGRYWGHIGHSETPPPEIICQAADCWINPFNAERTASSTSVVVKR